MKLSGCLSSACLRPRVSWPARSSLRPTASVAQQEFAQHAAPGAASKASHTVTSKVPCYVRAQVWHPGIPGLEKGW